MSKYKKIPEEVKKRLMRSSTHALETQNYLSAAELFEKYQEIYDLDEDLKCKLGLLYDHAAIFNLKKTDQKKLRLRYLKMAEDIYQEILTENKKSVFAWHGLSRIYDIQGRHREAWRCAKQAYFLWKKSPGLKSGPLGVGNSFLLAGHFKKAEYWFQKELKELGPSNLGVQANLLILYNTAKNYRQAYETAQITEKLLEEELNKPSRKRMMGKTGNKDKTIQFIKGQIRKAKLNAKLK